MFEEAINELESMGIPYSENEDGTLVIDIASADKTDVVTIVSFLNDNMLEYSIDANTITVLMPMGLEEEEVEDTDITEDAMAGAMGELF